MSRLDRYIVAEAVGPISLGFFVATFMLLIRSFFDLAEAIIRRGVDVPSVLKLLALNLPHIVVVTIPMALLFGILVAIGRLAGDSELTALRAAGVSLFYLYRGLLALSLLLTVLNLALMLWLLPWGNKTYTQLLLDQLSGSVTDQLEPRIFSEIIEGKTLYVFESPPGADAWQGVFLSDSLPVGDTSFTVAETGSVSIEDQGARIIVELENAVEQQLDLTEPTEAKISFTKSQILNSVDEARSTVHRSRSSRVRELAWDELRELADDEEREEALRALARVEMHKKFSIPAACLVFGLVAVPVGFSRRRGGGRSSAFAQSIGIIAIYYVFQNIGEERAANGQMEPWLSMWLPNLIFLFGGAFLVARKNGDKSVVLGNVDRWVRARLSRPLRSRRGGPT